MLIPQFSMRRMLAAVTGLSVVFLVLSLAIQGHIWAIGVIIGLLTLLVIAIIHGFTFFLVWLFATATAKRKAAKATKTAALLAAFLATREVFAGGAAHTFPTNGKPTASGLTVVLDTTWPDGFGYRPVTFNVTCSPPANADRTLSCEFGYSSWNPNEPQMTVKTDLDIPAGVAQISKTIAVPDFSIRYNYSLDTWEDGRHQSALSAKSLGAGSVYYDSSETVPAALFVAVAEPDATSLTALFPQPQYSSITGKAITSFAPQWAWRTPALLPDEWLCYQSLDLVFISLADLKALPAPRLAAIRDWTRAGGNLVVFGLGTDWSGLDQLNQCFKLGPSDERAAWNTPNRAHYRNSFSDVPLPAEQRATVTEVDDQGNVVTQPEKELTPPADAPFRFQPFQQGMVVALAPADPFGKTFDSNTWYWVLNSLGGARWLGIQRTGISHLDENLDFWTFLIPGVGGAPVNLYRVLITAFVVLIGPVNYLMLRKYNRLHLLLFTVPASALIVTAALLAYALIADGLHTRVRSRSFTMLDQRSGDAVAWARLAYYSGLAPSGGLRFERDIAPIPYSPRARASYDQARREFEARPDHNQLSRGWLPSRTPTQLITTHPYRTEQKLIVTEQGEITSVRNELGRPIHHLLACGDQGDFGFGTGILPGESQQLTILKPSAPGGTPPPLEGVTRLRDAFDAQTLSLPTGFDSGGGIELFDIRSNSYYYGNRGSYDIAAQQSTGRLETGLAAAKSAVIQAGSPGDATALKPRSYIAIIERPEQVPLGLEGAIESAGFHIIRGNW